MRVDELNQLLIDVFQVNPKQTRKYVFKVRNLKLMKLRDVLLQIGHITQENISARQYVVTMGAGFLKSNIAFLALGLDGDKLYVSVNAKEGLINQHTCEGAINELKKYLGGFIEGEE